MVSVISFSEFMHKCMWCVYMKACMHACVCVRTRTRVHVHVLVWMYIHVQVHEWRAKVNVQWRSLGVIYLPSERKSRKPVICLYLPPQH